MKTFTLAGIFMLGCASVIGQPVLTSAMGTFPIGFTDSINTATASVSPGSGGAGITWDLSGLSPVMAGSVKVITPSSSPYTATFPTATLCVQITPTGASSIYSYDVISSSGWEELANNYKGVGTGKNYTPNPESNLKFPFNYLDVFTDAFQTTTSSPSSADITYDGYGTLKTPFATYTNVVRIKKYWGPGDYAYNWYATSPMLYTVMTFDAQSNSYTFIGHSASNTAVKNAERNTTTTIYPNPMTDHATLIVDGSDLEQAMLVIYDINGRILRQAAVTGHETHLYREDLLPGLYLYQVHSKGSIIATGKLSVK